MLNFVENRRHTERLARSFRWPILLRRRRSRVWSEPTGRPGEVRRTQSKRRSSIRSGIRDPVTNCLIFYLNIKTKGLLFNIIYYFSI
jgi:hypothetical protein